MDDRSPLTFGVTQWHARAERELLRIADAQEHLDTWRAAVDEGRAQIWAVLDDGQRVGCVVWEVVHIHGQAEIHLLAASTGAETQSATSALYAAFTGLCAAARASRVYCETKRPGLVRLLTARGCMAAEIAPGLWGVSYE